MAICYVTKIKKQAEEIRNQITLGNISDTDLDELVKHGIDKNAIVYYKNHLAASKEQKNNECSQCKIATASVNGKCKYCAGTI